MTRNQKRKIRLDKHFARQVAGNVFRNATSSLNRLCFYDSFWLGGADRWLAVELCRKSPHSTVFETEEQYPGNRGRKHFRVASSASRLDGWHIEIDSWYISGSYSGAGRSVTESRQYASLMGFFHR